MFKQLADKEAADKKAAEQKKLDDTIEKLMSFVGVSLVSTSRSGELKNFEVGTPLALLRTKGNEYRPPGFLLRTAYKGDHSGYNIYGTDDDRQYQMDSMLELLKKKTKRVH